MEENRLVARQLNCDVTLEIVERFSVNPSQRQNLTSLASPLPLSDAHSTFTAF